MKSKLDLLVVENLIKTGSLHALKATISLDNQQNSLQLKVPGFNSQTFHLAESSEIIISILCREIPYIISDLLNLVESPVFYKGHLIMEVNQQLVLLEPSTRSLETDVQYLAHNVSRRKKTELERHFWLKVKSNMHKKRRRVLWCPAREVYREYLRKLIDFKLCSPLIAFDASGVKERLEAFEEVTSESRIMGKSLQDANILKLHPTTLARKLQLGSNRGCYSPSSVFIANCSPLELMAKKRGQSRLMDGQQCTSLLEGEQKWLEITCDTPTKLQAQQSSESQDGRRVNGCVSAQNGQSDHNKGRPSGRRFSIRIFQGLTGHFWARPTLSEAKLKEMQADCLIQLPQPCFLDCQDYLNKLFCSINERGTMLVEVIKPLNTALECVLPEKIQNLIDSTSRQSNGYSASINCRIDANKMVYTILFNKKT